MIVNSEYHWLCLSPLVLQIMDLESRNAQLLEEVSHARANPSSVDGSGSSARSSPDWIPRAPAKHTLTGHRAPITSVCFHPVFAALVTASEDSTLKIWDWESGEYEQTLKGHTKAVTDCDYDSKGNFLGKLHSRSQGQVALTHLVFPREQQCPLPPI